MKTLTNNKGILGIIAIFILSMFLYNLLFKSDAISTPSDSSATSIGNDLLETLKKLQAVTLDQTVLSSPGYLLLTDFGIEILPQATGRVNPFGPIK